MATNFSNTAANTNLDGAINDTVTTLDVDSATGYPAVPFNIYIGDEVIRVGAKSSLTFSSLTRGYDDTTAASHADNDPVAHVGIAEDLQSVMFAENTYETFGASSSAFAWKGAAVIPHFDVKIWAVMFIGTVVDTADYQAAVITGTSTISTITKGVTITADSDQAESGEGTLILPFNDPVLLTAGTEYFLMCGRTDSTDTYAFPCQYPASGRFHFPFGGMGTNGSARVAKASPAVSDTINFFTDSPTRTGALWSLV